jgi:hypothetical protein
MNHFCFAVVARLEEDVSRLSIQVSELESSGEELTESKVRLEMRAVDLEEQRDRAIDEAKELEVTIDNLKSELKVRASRQLFQSEKGCRGKTRTTISTHRV